jgi:tetratricopeptide (TPR) repeat protein
LFQEILRLTPNSPEAHHDLGFVLLRHGRLTDAAVSLKRAVELRPGFDSALRHLAGALEQGGRRTEALPIYRKLSRTADDPIERRYYSAKSLAVEGKPDEAEKELRRLLALAPHDAGTHTLLGELLSSRGSFEEAAQYLAKAVEARPSAFEQLAAVKRMADADRPLLDRMHVLAQRPDLDGESCIAIHFGLGKAFDDLGDYAEGMRHYEAANALRAMSTRLDREALAREYDSIIARFPADAIAQAGQSLTGRERPRHDIPVLIVGMPRSGTTLVEQILSSHPAVVGGGELSFWKHRGSAWRASGIGALDSGSLAKAAEDYCDELRRIGPEALRVTDKGPYNFELLGLIRVALPGARIIHCLRHPIDTCLSIFFTNFAASQDYAWDRGDLVYFYRQYRRLMDHWRRVLPADRFTEVEYDRLVAYPDPETRRLVDFLGLDWADACLAPERNKRIVRTASVWQARQPIYRTSVERWRRYEPWLGELRELLPEAEGAGPLTTSPPDGAVQMDGFCRART